MTRKFSDLGTKLSSYWYKIGIFSKEILGTTKTQDRKEMLVSDKRNSRHQQPPPQLHTLKSSLSTTFTPHLCSPWRKVPKDLHLRRTTKPPCSKYLGIYLSPLTIFPPSLSPPLFLPSQPQVQPLKSPFFRILKNLSLQHLTVTSAGKLPLSISSCHVLWPFVTLIPACPNDVFSSGVHMCICLPGTLPPILPPLLRRPRATGVLVPRVAAAPGAAGTKVAGARATNAEGAEPVAGS